MAALFPGDDAALRDLAWRSHLMNDNGPVRGLMSDLEGCYLEEIDRLSVTTDSQAHDRNVRQRRFASYVMVLVLEGAATEQMLERFMARAPAAFAERLYGMSAEKSQSRFQPFLKLPDSSVLPIGTGGWQPQSLPRTGANIAKSLVRSAIGVSSMSSMSCGCAIS